jgi:hypothetical protein
MAKKKGHPDLIWQDDVLCEPQKSLFSPGCQPYSGTYGSQGFVTERGASSMASDSAFPSVDAGFSACSLARTLETEADWLTRHPGKTPRDFWTYLERYYLSARAAAGILRRAASRNRKLPKMLEDALRAIAGVDEVPPVEEIREVGEESLKD